LRKEEEIEKEMERAAAVKIPVVSENDGGNGSLSSDSSISPSEASSRNN
jgi:AAA family ATP:ADP antiporter